MQKTTRIGVVLFLCLTCLTVNAQKVKEKIKEKKPPVAKKNVVKLNLSALAFQNISVQYERAIGKKTSIAANIRTIPFGKLPFQSTFNDIGNSSDVRYDQFKLGSFGIVPEVRFYLGHKGALHGFYIGPFFSYSSYKMNLPLNYMSGLVNKTGIFDGKLSAVTGGLQLGAQFSLGKNVVLDWWILGPNYGAANGTLNFTATLNAQEQSDLKANLEDLKNKAPLNTIKSYTVNGNGANVIAKGPWVGLRGLGLCLGIRL